MQTVDYFWLVTAVLLGSIGLAVGARLLLAVRKRRQARAIEAAADDLAHDRASVHEIR
jgi:hypothetical protein